MAWAVAIGWLWKGFKGNSVTFALVSPGLFFSWLAKREDRIIPDEAKRKLWARGLIAGSILLALLIAWIRK